MVGFAKYHTIWMIITSSLGSCSMGVLEGALLAVSRRRTQQGQPVKSGTAFIEAEAETLDG
jgi:hypothetical protein